MGTYFDVVKHVEYAGNALFAVSVMLPLFMMRIYLVPFCSVVWEMVKTFPLIDFFIDIIFPELVLSTILTVFPNLIGTL